MFPCAASGGKYLKAVLQENGQVTPKTHQLVDLLGLCIKLDSTYQLLYADLSVLEGYAVKFRYPGDAANKIEARKALKAVQTVRAFIRSKLGFLN